MQLLGIKRERERERGEAKGEGKRKGGEGKYGKHWSISCLENDVLLHQCLTFGVVLFAKRYSVYIILHFLEHRVKSNVFLCFGYLSCSFL